jgi:hypothetical protein
LLSSSAELSNLDDGDEGQRRNWYFITAGDGFSHAFEADMPAVVKSLGDEGLGSARYPAAAAQASHARWRLAWQASSVGLKASP